MFLCVFLGLIKLLGQSAIVFCFALYVALWYSLGPFGGFGVFSIMVIVQSVYLASCGSHHSVKGEPFQSMLFRGIRWPDAAAMQVLTWP